MLTFSEAQQLRKQLQVASKEAAAKDYSQRRQYA